MPLVLLLLHLVLLIATPTTNALICFTCVQSPGTTQLDNFRVSTRLPAPVCRMEPIRCDRDQDVCVRISMHIGGGEYWMGAGCDRRVNFQHLACQNVRTVSRSVQLGYVQERHAMQRVCVCTRDMCNQSDGFGFTLPLTLAVLYLLLR
ncbi:unnamed protein product [Heligmosomoides polygyrus]|uniref:Protein quiver n=1 Tax=Heligmosomoides polygyrus TaxID=6339 RepID=A0A3P7X4J0_HELPZ|nr:unnamed protein product [Heligmosomoides polygyrus]